MKYYFNFTGGTITIGESHSDHTHGARTAGPRYLGRTGSDSVGIGGGT